LARHAAALWAALDRSAEGRRRLAACDGRPERGLLRTRLVKMNSKRELLYFVMTCSAWVLPRSRLLAVLMLSEITQL
jgi:hypothetical protein